MTTAGYEFTTEENETFKGLVQGMKRSGLVVAIASIILLAYHLIEVFNVSLGGEPSPAIYYLDVTVWCLIAIMGVTVSILLVRATGAFHAVIHTQGDDVKHLMSGLARLREILHMIFVAASAASVLLAVSFTLLLLYA
jgi:hypothetical protein